MDKLNVAVVLWSFLVGLIIGIWAGQTIVAQRLLSKIKEMIKSGEDIRPSGKEGTNKQEDKD